MRLVFHSHTAAPWLTRLYPTSLHAVLPIPPFSHPNTPLPPCSSSHHPPCPLPNTPAFSLPARTPPCPPSPLTLTCLTWCLSSLTQQKRIPQRLFQLCSYVRITFLQHRETRVRKDTSTSEACSTANGWHAASLLSADPLRSTRLDSSTQRHIQRTQLQLHNSARVVRFLSLHFSEQHTLPATDVRSLTTCFPARRRFAAVSRGSDTAGFVPSPLIRVSEQQRSRRCDSAHVPCARLPPCENRHIPPCENRHIPPCQNRHIPPCQN